MNVKKIKDNFKKSKSSSDFDFSEPYPLDSYISVLNSFYYRFRIISYDFLDSHFYVYDHVIYIDDKYEHHKWYSKKFRNLNKAIKYYII